MIVLYVLYREAVSFVPPANMWYISRVCTCTGDGVVETVAITAGTVVASLRVLTVLVTEAVTNLTLIKV